MTHKKEGHIHDRAAKLQLWIQQARVVGDVPISLILCAFARRNPACPLNCQTRRILGSKRTSISCGISEYSLVRRGFHF